MPETNGEPKPKVFISYSRSDVAFADQLVAALQLCGFEPTIDRHDISGGEDWKARLGAMILEASSVVFILSPAAARSETCAWEVKEVERLAKRLVPIVCASLGQSALPQGLENLNYIYFYPDDKAPGSGFGEGLARLVATLRTNLDWIREHTHFGSLAARWDGRGRAATLLLRGAELEDAERWLAAHPSDAPDPGPLTRAYLRASRETEDVANTKKLRDTRRIAVLTTIGCAVAIVLAAFAGRAEYVASQQRNEAERLRAMAEQAEKMASSERDRAQFAQSRALLALSQQYLAVEDHVTSALLALETLGNAAAETPDRISPEAQLSLDSAMRGVREVAVLSGHTRAVSGAAFSPDGTRILTWSDDNTARVFAAQTRQELAVLKTHEGPVRSAAFSPDGSLIATASTDKTARVFDAATGRERTVLKGHQAAVRSVAFNSDATLVVTGSEDGTVRIWSTADGQRKLQFQVGDKVNMAVFSPDGAFILTAAGRGAQIWDAASGKYVASLWMHRGEVFAAAFSPDGSQIATSSFDKTVRLWDAKTFREIAVVTGHQASVWSATFSPEGGRIVTASYDKTARIWDASTGRQISVLKGHSDEVRSARFDASGRQVVTASLDATARLWDLDKNDGSVVLHQRPSVRKAAFSPDGEMVLTASWDVAAAHVWDARSGRRLLVLRADDKGAGVTAVSFNSDGRLAVTASADGSARIWDTKTGNVTTILKGHGAPLSSAVFSPTDDRVLTASVDKTARIWDAKTGVEIAILKGHEDHVVAAEFNRDGTRVATASFDKTARIWDAGTGHEIAVLQGHRGKVYAANFSPDGSLIATGSADTDVRIWNAQAGTTVAVLKSHTQDVLTALFSPDGERLLTASFDRTARIWNARTGAELAVLKGHDGGIFFGAFSADGKLAATGSYDTTARVWDVASGKELSLLKGHTDSVLPLSFSRDGTKLLTGSLDGTARVWPLYLDPRALAEHARNLVPRCLTGEQRQQLSLAPMPPPWCFELGKWPYDTATARATTAFKAGEFMQAFRQWKMKAEADEKRLPSDPGQTAEVAADYGRLSWYALFAREFGQALQAAEKAISMDPDNGMWVETNLAHALMHLGRKEEARKVYLAHKGQPIKTRGVKEAPRWNDVIRKDFADLRGAGLADPLMDQVEREFGNE
jgi:WD40 repeat protein